MGDATDKEIWGPLWNLYSRAGLALPKFELMEGPMLPEPYQTLLVHHRDMTRTLEAHHQSPIHLRLLDQMQEGLTYSRTVVLALNKSDRPVEFGASRVLLKGIPEPWCAQIIEAHLPLGGILNASGIPYRSQPSAFFRTLGDDLIRSALRVEGLVPLYGRRNTLSASNGSTLAEIVEILPP